MTEAKIAGFSVNLLHKTPNLCSSPQKWVVKTLIYDFLFFTYIYAVKDFYLCIV